MENETCSSIVLSIFAALIGFAGTILGAFIAYFLAARQVAKADLSIAKSELITRLMCINKEMWHTFAPPHNIWDSALPTIIPAYLKLRVHISQHWLRIIDQGFIEATGKDPMTLINEPVCKKWGDENRKLAEDCVADLVLKVSSASF
jgi:hypothetical protein